jgi:uncharacterized small protein (DUF1192 family)
MSPEDVLILLKRYADLINKLQDRIEKLEAELERRSNTVG